MNQTNATIVISRHKKDVSWTKRFVENAFRVIVYDHHAHKNHPYYIPKNQGREAAVYIQYIISYYDALTPFTIFLHDQEYSWHHDKSIVDLVIENIGTKKRYLNLNNVCLGLIKTNPLWPYMVSYFRTCLEPYIGSMELYGDFTPGYKCCAQFICHKQLIHRFPKQMYANILEYLIDNNELDEKAKGHMLEWTWHLLFANPFIVQKMSKQAYNTYQTQIQNQANARVFEVCSRSSI